MRLILSAARFLLLTLCLLMGLLLILLLLVICIRCALHACRCIARTTTSLLLLVVSRHATISLGLLPLRFGLPTTCFFLRLAIFVHILLHGCVDCGGIILTGEALFQIRARHVAITGCEPQSRPQKTYVARFLLLAFGPALLLLLSRKLALDFGLATLLFGNLALADFFGSTFFFGELALTDFLRFFLIQQGIQVVGILARYSMRCDGLTCSICAISPGFLTEKSIQRIRRIHSIRSCAQ